MSLYIGGFRLYDLDSVFQLSLGYRELHSTPPQVLL